jgi:uncharacterized protein (UPF0335 family)
MNSTSAISALYRAEAACALARLEAARRRIERLERENALLREENARLARAGHASGQFVRVSGG